MNSLVKAIIIVPLFLISALALLEKGRTQTPFTEQVNAIKAQQVYPCEE